MKSFSLLQALQNPPAKSPVEDTAPQVEPEAVVEATKTAYRVYEIETEDGCLKVGVPIGNVEQFDSYFTANPSAISEIQEHLEQFEAVVI